MKNIIANIVGGGGKTLSYLPAALGRTRVVASALVALLALAAAQPAQAKDCYWAGGTSSDWGTVENWTTGNKVPDNDGAYFRKDKFNGNFTSGDMAYIVTFGAAKSNTWRTYFNNCGSAGEPIILRSTGDASFGLTSGAGSSSDFEGIYIGTAYKHGTADKDNNAGEGDAYVRFETGTFKTGSYSCWFIGNATYAGHVVAVGSTLQSGHIFYLYNGSFHATNTTLKISSANCFWGCQANKTASVVKNGGTWQFGQQLHLGSASGASASFCQDGGSITVANYANLGCQNGGSGFFTNKAGTVTFSNQTSLGGNGGNCTFVMDGGTLKFNRSDDDVNGSLSVGYGGGGGDAYFHHNGGDTTVAGNMNIVRDGSGEFNMNGGTVTVGKKVVFGSHNLNGSEFGRLNLNGGVFSTPYLNYHNGDATANVRFNGGTLKITGSGAMARGDTISGGTDYSSIANLESVLLFKVASQGGTIDTAGNSVTMPLAISEDSSSTGGGMTFAGGGTMTLSGSVGYTGATTLTNGTKLVVKTTAAVSAILSHGLVVAIPDGGVTNGTEVVVLDDGDNVINASQLSNSSVSGYNASCYGLALSANGKSVVVNFTAASPYTWTAGDSGDSWLDAGKWRDANSAMATWANDNTNPISAVFAAAGDSATVGAAVKAAEVSFTANGTVGGSGTLTVPVVSVSSGVDAAINATTSGGLEKTGEGKLTLGASRTEQTTVSEGTLAMSGGATLNASKLTLGTDVAKAVALDYGGGAFSGNLTSALLVGGSAKIDNGSYALTSTLSVKNGKLSIASNANVAIPGHSVTVGGDSSMGNSTTIDATLVIDGGSVTNSNAATHCFIGDYGAAGSVSTMVVKNGGSYCSSGDIYVANRSTGRLVVDDAEATASGTLYFCYNAECLQGEDGYVSVTNGGVIAAKGVAYRTNGGAGNGYFNFDGGTLAALDEGTLIVSHDRLFVNVNADGGTIDNRGYNVAIEESMSGIGSMTFSGTGTTTLSASQSYEGATTVKSGTCLRVPGSGTTLAGGLVVEDSATLAIASPDTYASALTVASVTLPESGAVTLSFNAVPSDGRLYRILTRTDGVAFSDGDKAKFSLGSLEGFVIAITDGGASIAVCGGHNWTGADAATGWNVGGNWTCGEAPSDGADANFNAALVVNRTATFGSAASGAGNVYVDAGTADAPIVFEATGEGGGLANSAILHVGDAADAALWLKGGTYTSSGGMILGRNGGTTAGHLLLGGGAVPTAFDLGSANLQMYGRSSVFGGEASITNVPWFNINDSGCVLVLTNSSVSAKGLNVALNSNADSTAVFCESALTVTDTSNPLVVGYKDGSIGRLYATNLTVKSSGKIAIGGHDTYGGIGATGIVEKVGGVWNCTQLRVGNGKSSHAEFYHRGGSLVVETSYLQIGYGSGSEAYFELDGGVVTGKTNNVIIGDQADVASAKAVVKGGGELYCGQNLYVGYKSAGSLEVTNGAVRTPGNAYLSASVKSGTAKSRLTLLDSGLLEALGLTSNNDGTITESELLFDGGTYKAVGDNVWFVDAKHTAVGGQDIARVVVKVGERGGTIDTANHKVSIRTPMSRADGVATDGGLNIIGGGTLTLQLDRTTDTSISYVGDTTVETDTGIRSGVANTTLTGDLVLQSGSCVVVGPVSSEPSCLSANNMSMASVVTVVLENADYAPGSYPILVKTGGGAFTQADVDNIEIDASAMPYPACSYTCALGGTGDDSIVLKVSRHGVWTGSANNGDFHDPANWEDRKVPVAGEDVWFDKLSEATTVNVTDASVAGVKFGKVTTGDNVVTFTGTFTATNFTNMAKVAVGENSTVKLDGDLEFSGSGDQYVIYSVAAGGRFVVTGDIVANCDFTGHLYHSKSSSAGAVQARGLVNNATGNADHWAFRLSPDLNANWKADWIIGDHGISGSRFFWITTDCNVEVQPTNSDFVVLSKIGVIGTLTFNTTDTAGNPSTVTIGNGGEVQRTGAVNVAGTGRVVVDFAGTSSSTYANPVTVTNTATLAIKPGKTMTTGVITVADGATLAIPQSGEVALGGGLALANGATLAFNFTERQPAPVLDVTDKTVTVAEGGTIKIAVSGKWPKGENRKVTLTSGGKFSGKTVELAGGCPSWAKRVDVVNGDIVLEVKPMAVMVTVK